MKVGGGANVLVGTPVWVGAGVGVLITNGVFVAVKIPNGVLVIVSGTVVAVAAIAVVGGIVTGVSDDGGVMLFVDDGSTAGTWVVAAGRGVCVAVSVGTDVAVACGVTVTSGVIVSVGVTVLVRAVAQAIGVPSVGRWASSSSLALKLQLASANKRTSSMPNFVLHHLNFIVLNRS